jgi:transposase InsO family protein
MHDAGICALRRRRKRKTAPTAPLEAIRENVLDRQFAPEEPCTVWTADITYLPTAEGWLYLAVVIDLYSRRVIGWAVRSSLAKELAMSALKNAIQQRRPSRGLIHHSDRGSQYTSYEYQSLLRREGITISMSRSGSCHDNAPTESFFGSLKTEMFLRGDPFDSQAEARQAVFEYIEVFYNRQRRHSTLGYKTPMEFEQQYINQQTTAT